MRSTQPGIVADSSAAGLTAQLEEVWGSLASLGARLTDAEWNTPTQCPGWPVSAQYAHIIGTESMLLGRPRPGAVPGRPEHVRNDIGGLNEVWVAALAERSRAEVLRLLEEVTAERSAALRSMDEGDFSRPSWTPVGQADYRRFMQIRVFDCWVHEQDVRLALDRPGHEDGAPAEQSTDEIVRALGYIVGKKAGAAEGSSVVFSLTGPVRREVGVEVAGGRAHLAEPPESPSSALSLGSGAFARIACGRVAPETVMNGDLGGVLIAGDPELAGRVLANLAFTI